MHKRWLLFFISIIQLLNSFAQSYDSLCLKAAQSESQFNEKQALYYYKQAALINPKNLDVLYNCADLCQRIGSREKDEKRKLQLIDEAFSFAKSAYKYHPNSDKSCVIMSVVLGNIALNKSGSEKLDAVKEVKKYSEKALSINPQNFLAWYVLGRWHFELSNLNFIEKSAIRIFFGGMPDASFSKAINAFEKSKSLKPNFCLDYLQLAKAYYANKQKDKAKTILHQLSKLPISTFADKDIKIQGLSLLKEWD